MATTPGAMSLFDIQSRALHLLREPGPDTNGTGVVPITGDFPAALLVRDANIWLGSMLGEAGVPPSLTDTMATYTITPGLDYTLPANLSSLQRVEYTPAGQQQYVVFGYSMEAFDSETGGIVPIDTGQPRIYRAPYAGKIRLVPAPDYSNAGIATGVFTIPSTLVTGNTVTLYLVNGGTTITVGPYTVVNGDTAATIAINLTALINASAAVTGGSPFLGTAVVDGNTITVPALVAGLAGNALAYYGTNTGAGGVTIVPSMSTTFAGGGIPDTITLYYESLGTILVNATDVPAIPAQFHRGILYGMLSEYWLRKNDPVQAKAYEGKYDRVVARMKAYQFDLAQSSQPTIAGDDFDDEFPFPVGGG